MQNFWLKIKGLFQKPKSRYKVILTIVGATTLVLVVLFSGGIDNLLRIFGPRAFNLLWNNQTSLGTDRAEGATVQVKRDGRIYLYALGGLQKAGDGVPTYLNSVEYAELNSSGDISGGWRFAEPMISERAGLRAVVYNANPSDGNDDYIYAVAGDFHIPPSGSFGPWTVLQSEIGTNLASYLASKNTSYSVVQWQQLIESGAVSLFLGTGGVQNFSVPDANQYISGSSQPIVNAKNWNWVLPPDVWKWSGGVGTLDLQLSVSIGSGEPLPYSTVERFNLNTKQWEPVSILTDVNYYPEVAIIGGKLHITGGVYGKLFEAKEAGDFSSSWGTFDSSLGGSGTGGETDGGTTGGTTGGGVGGDGVMSPPPVENVPPDNSSNIDNTSGTGDIGDGTTENVTPATPTQPALPSVIGLLRQFFNLDGAFAQTIDPTKQKDFDVWLRFSNLPKVGKGFVYLSNSTPLWIGTGWVTAPPETQYEWRETIVETTHVIWDGSGIRIVKAGEILRYRAAIETTQIAYPPPNPVGIYSQSLINGSFWTTTSIAYTYDLTASTWTSGELPDTTAYSSYTTINNLNGKFVKVGAIRLDIQAIGGGMMRPSVSLAPLAQGRYGHQMVNFSDSINAVSGTYIFGGASVGSGRYKQNPLGGGDIYTGVSPFWAVEGIHPIIATGTANTRYQYTAPVSLTLDGTNWIAGSSVLAFKNVNGSVQGRAFHQIAKLTDSQNSLLAVGGLINSFITPISFKAVPTRQVYQLNNIATGWSAKTPLAQDIYSPTVMASGNKAVIAGGAIDFPSQPHPQSTAYWPNYTVTATGATYIWDNETWASSGSMINHGNLLGYSFASVATQDPVNSYNSLYVLGGYNPVSKLSNKLVERFQLSAVNPQEFSATNSTVEVSDSPADANGTDTATVVITVKDGYDNPITSGRYQVGLAIYNPPTRLNYGYLRAKDIILPDTSQAPVSPDGNGQVTFTVKSTESTAPGIAYFQVQISDTEKKPSVAPYNLRAEVEFVPAITSVEPNFIQPGRSVDVEVYAYGTHFSPPVSTPNYARGTNVRLSKVISGITASVSASVIPARTSSQSTVKIKLVNSTGGPDIGKTVQLSIDGGGSLSSSSLTTDARGEATAIYTSDTTAGLVKIHATGSGHSTYTFIFKTDVYGNNGYAISVQADPVTLTAGSGRSSTVTATYLKYGSPVPNESIELYAVSTGDVTTLTPISAETNSNGQAQFTYQATGTEGIVRFVALGKRDTIPVVGWGILHQTPANTANQVTISNIRVPNPNTEPTYLIFTATAPANLADGQYTLVISSWLHDYNIPPRITWEEVVSYPFSVISTTSGILSYQPKESDRGKTVEDFIVYGGTDTDFLLGSTQLIFTPIGTSSSNITSTVTSTPNSHELHATLVIPDNAYLGYWNFKVKTVFVGAPSKEWSVAGDTDFKVTEPLENLLDLELSTVSAVPRYVPTSTDGSKFSRVTVTLRDKDFNGLSGRLVSVTSNRTDDDTIVAINDVTDPKGRAMFKVWSDKAGLSTITADSEGITIGEADIQFESSTNTTLIPVTLSIKVPLQANAYDRQVKLFLLEKTVGQKPTIDEAYFTNSFDIITELELPRMYLHKGKDYTLWAKSRYHLARVEDFTTSGATISVDFTKSTPDNLSGGLLIGDFRGTPDKWLSAFHDNKINVMDFWLPISKWNVDDLIANINRGSGAGQDYKVNNFDLGFLIRNFGSGAPLP